MKYYNRYTEFQNTQFIPFIELGGKPTDKTVVFRRGKHTAASLSQEYYGSPYFEFLIRMKNSNLGVDESEYPDNTVIVVPFPLKESIQSYISNIELYKEKYG